MADVHKWLDIRRASRIEKDKPNETMARKRRRGSATVGRRRRNEKTRQRGGLFPFLALIPAAAAVAAKAAATGAISAAAGYAAKGHLKRDDHIFTKKFWTRPKEVRRGGYIYSADGKYRRKA